jgi:hypothetical protein
MSEAGIHQLSERRLRQLDETDGMSPELRQCVHEYGYPIVNCLLNLGVRKPSHIRQIVMECWAGARQPMQRNRGGGQRETLDWLLIQQGAQISAATLIRVLADNHMVIVPVEPTPRMIEASKATVSGGGQVMTKSEKHRRRLRAAIAAAREHLWPELKA